MKSTGRTAALSGAVPGVRSVCCFIRRELGSATVEVALILPVLLVLATGMISFGHAQNQYVELINATASASSYLSARRGNTTDPCYDGAQRVYAAAPYLDPNSLSLTYILNGTTYGPYKGVAANTCSSSSTGTGAAGDLIQGDPVKVVATYPCSLGVYGANFIPGCTLHAELTEIVQ
jgi:Flp pilus assembly protein TadG